jgi:hypothetical protein
LKSDRSEINDQKKNLLISKLYEMEEQVNEKEEKCKEQMRIN